MAGGRNGWAERAGKVARNDVFSIFLRRQSPGAFVYAHRLAERMIDMP